MTPGFAYRLAAALLAAALAYRFFPTISRVLLLIYAAAILGVVLNGVVRAIPLHRRWATALVGLAILALLGLGTWFGGRELILQAQSLRAQAPEIREQLDRMARDLTSAIGVDVNLAARELEDLVREWLGNNSIASRAWGLVQGIIGFVVILFGGLFAVAKPNKRLLVSFLRAVPSAQRSAWRRFFELLANRLRQWVLGQAISMATIGALATLAFYLIGVPYALVLGVVNGIAEIVPIAGPWLGGVPAVVIALLDEPSKALWTAGAIVGIQMIESQLITPIVMSQAARVHPFITLFAILLFGGMLGFLGVLLALPLVLLFGTAIQVFWVERVLDARRDRIPIVARE